MRKKRIVQGILSSLGIMVLIIDGKTAYDGAAQGLALCLLTVIPTLFPFFLFSILLTSSVSMTGRWIHPIEKLFRIPQGSAPLLVPAFLAGYPVGAKTAADLARNKIVPFRAAERMLAFCSNAGPAFLFGILKPIFPNTSTLFLLWGSLILGAILAAQVFPSDVGRVSGQINVTESEPILSAAIAIVRVCGWVILFRTVIAFLDRWIFFLLPGWLKVLLSGLLELSNGCCLLPLINNIDLRLIVCSVILSLGGLCITMQTVSVTNGLSLRFYFLGKLIQCAVSTAVCFAWIQGILWLVLTIAVFLMLILRMIEKRSRFSGFVGV